MSCSAIMARAPLTLREDESIGEATAKLLVPPYADLPVIDAGGRFAGMVGIHDLLGLVVPRVALAGDILSNLRFIGDDPDDLRRKFREVTARRVSEIADRNCATLDPDAPEIEAIRLLCRSLHPIPVVEKKTGRLLGVISCADGVRALALAPALS